MMIPESLRRREWLIRLTNWEYWPFNVVYGPLYPYWLFLVMRSGSLFFFNTSNPRIRNGGFLLESKREIYELLPEGSYPETLFFKAGTAWAALEAAIQASSLRYPLVAKPDVGMRGMLVQRVEHAAELRAFATQAEVDFLVQSLVEYPMEAGIFYYRYPGEEEGRISGIVGKAFLTVKGDGRSIVEALIRKDPRALLQLRTLRHTQPGLLDTVLPEGEERILVPYGNHARGSKFWDCSAEADEQLHHEINWICSRIPGFYFGRLDIRFRSWDELRAGKHFSIIELNGAGSEPTHMYDPAHSIFFAWKEILRHWNILFRISRLNHRQLNMPYMPFRQGVRMLRENSAYVKKISKPLRLELNG